MRDESGHSSACFQFIMCEGGQWRWMDTSDINGERYTAATAAACVIIPTFGKRHIQLLIRQHIRLSTTFDNGIIQQYSPQHSNTAGPTKSELHGFQRVVITYRVECNPQPHRCQ